MQKAITQIPERLQEERNIHILYACESGSRAWGFPSPDSDYDVRFIYAHPVEWYLSIGEQKDTIELPVNELLDAGGWDIRKVLGQMRKSNPVIFEWLQAPVVYRQHPVAAAALRALMPFCFSPRAVVYHHLGLVRKMLAETEGADIRLKKAFYLLRSLLSAAWVRESSTLPPMTFGALRVQLAGSGLENLVEEWLALKVKADEKTRVPRPDVFAAFVERETAASEVYARTAPVQVAETERLNQIFRTIITTAHDH